MATAPDRFISTSFDQLTDEELKGAMIMHIRMGYLMKNPGKSKEAEAIAQDIVNRLSFDQLKQIHPDTFFSNKKMGELPKNPYEVALALLGEG
jgi:hypothetical protein